MNPDLQHLIELQALDLAAERYRRRVADIPAQQAALDERLASRTAAVDAVKARIAANQTARRDIERDLATIQARLSKYKGQLMEVKTNKEYQAMQKEIAVAEQEISDLETKLLERMEEADGLAAELKTAEAALTAEQADIARDRAALDAERGQAESALQQTIDDRARVAALVSRDALSLFERVASGRKGVALAEARDGICTVCHVRLRPQVFNELRKNDGLLQCDSCSRILYYVPPAPAGAPAASPDTAPRS